MVLQEEILQVEESDGVGEGGVGGGPTGTEQLPAGGSSISR